MLFDFLRKRTIRTLMTPGEVRVWEGQGPIHKREWICPCGARLSIKSRQPHADHAGSNLTLKAPNDLGERHADLPPHHLTWNGLAEERGWKTDPIQCPACQRGMSVSRYREMRRREFLEFAARKDAWVKARQWR